jgi:protein SERAC1
MWLVDSLPKDLENARIITIGFDTKLVDSKSTQGIGELANFLRTNLEAIRDGPGASGATSSRPGNRRTGKTVPLIFIAHSLGGLVVKEVCIACLPPGISN